METPETTTLLTSRMRLEPVVEAHLEGIFAIDREPEVRRYTSDTPATWQQTMAWVARAQRCWAAWGFGWWAFVESASDRVIGTGCTHSPADKPSFPPTRTPCETICSSSSPRPARSCWCRRQRRLSVRPEPIR